jgi:hypothetical protein
VKLSQRAVTLPEPRVQAHEHAVRFFVGGLERDDLFHDTNCLHAFVVLHMPPGRLHQ